MLCMSLNSYSWSWWPIAIHPASDARDTLLYGVSLRGVSSYGRTAPFWLQTNQNGDIAPAPHSGNLAVELVKPATAPHRWFDYDFGVALTGRIQSQSNNIIPQMNRIGSFYSNLAYAHARLYVVDITAGILPQYQDLSDCTISSGGLLFSNNAHPMPTISIGIDKWTAFPGVYGYLEVRGGISNMWMIDNVYVNNAMVHYKWIGGKIGGKLPVNLSYEFHHVAQWGGFSPIYGNLGNNWSAFMNAFLVQSGGSMANDQHNAQGNHIGSQILTLEVKGNEWNASAYWQNLSEDGPIRFIGFGMNNRDGLWGVNFSQNRWPFINGLTYEFVHTTDQSGPFHDRDGLIFGGNDNYYNNGVYVNGWNYWYQTIGSPFITSPRYNTSGEIRTTNNRIRVHHIGLKGDIYGYKYRAICSYVDNYGTYNTPSYSNNTAILLECSKHFDKAWGMDISLSIAADFGCQFGNQLGAMITIKKQGIITEW